MVPAARATSSTGKAAPVDGETPQSTTSLPIPAGTPAASSGDRSTVIMSMLTRPTMRVFTPPTSTGVPVGAWRG